MALTIVEPSDSVPFRVYQAIKEAPVNAAALVSELELAIGKRLRQTNPPGAPCDGHLATSRFSFTDWSVVQIRLRPDVAALTAAEMEAVEAAIAAHVAQ